MHIMLLFNPTKKTIILISILDPSYYNDFVYAEKIDLIGQNRVFLTNILKLFNISV